jgi:hypothetical protein
MGGSAHYSCNSVETKSLSEHDFKLSAEAKFKSKGGSIGGDTTLTDQEKQIMNNVEGDIALDVRGGGAKEAQELRQNKPAAWGKWADSVKLSPAFMGFPEMGLVPIWQLVSDQHKRQELELAYKKLAAQNFPVEIFWSTTTSPSGRPDASVVIPDEYKLLSGGAFISDETPNRKGVLLTASFPESDNRWRAMGKDHVESDSASLTAYAMALYDPDDIWETRIFPTESSLTAHPNAIASIKDGNYVLVGGGARVNYNGAGNMLTASYPFEGGDGVQNVPMPGPVSVPVRIRVPAWLASSKDHHGASDAATLTGYAIGLRSKLAGVTVEKPSLTDSPSAEQGHPSAEATPPSGYKMVGGGARVDYGSGAGNLLTASYPLDSKTWKVTSKDHLDSSPARIHAYALGVKVSAS